MGELCKTMLLAAKRLLSLFRMFGLSSTIALFCSNKGEPRLAELDRPWEGVRAGHPRARSLTTYAICFQ